MTLVVITRCYSSIKLQLESYTALSVLDIIIIIQSDSLWLECQAVSQS